MSTKFLYNGRCQKICGTQIPGFKSWPQKIGWMGQGPHSFPLRGVWGGIGRSEGERRLFPGLPLKNRDPPEAAHNGIFLKGPWGMRDGHECPSSVGDEPPPKGRKRSPSPRNIDLGPIRGRGHENTRGPLNEKCSSHNLNEIPIL